MIDDFDVEYFMQKWEKINPEISFSLKMEADVLRLFNDVKYEPMHINKTYDEWEMFITGLCSDVYKVYDREGGLSEDKFKAWERENSGNKHMEGFNVVLGNGIADDIQAILNKYEKSTSLFKGFKFDRNDPDRDLGDGVRINYKLSENSDISLEPELFEIYIDGNLVYQWKEGVVRYNILKDGEYKAEFTEDHTVYFEGGNPFARMSLAFNKDVNRYINKHSKNSNRINSVKIVDEGRVLQVEEVDINGKVRYRNMITGRYMAKDNRPRDKKSGRFIEGRRE